MRNASRQGGGNEQQLKKKKKKEQEHKQQNFLWAQRHFSMKRVTSQFQVATTTAKKKEEKKSALQVHSWCCFLLIRPFFFPYSLPSPFSLSKL